MNFKIIMKNDVAAVVVVVLVEKKSLNLMELIKTK
jgi:hypothetical protein